MEKPIIDSIYFRVNEKDEKEFIAMIKDVKNILTEADSLPSHIALFKDIDQDKTLYTWNWYFISDSAFDEWDAKLPKDVREKVIAKFSKFTEGYNYSEQVELD